MTSGFHACYYPKIEYRNLNYRNLKERWKLKKTKTFFYYLNLQIITSKIKTNFLI